MEDLPRLPFPRANVLDLPAMYATLRTESPITRVRTPNGDVAWLVTRYDDIKSLLCDERLGVSHPDPARAPKHTASKMSGPVKGVATEREDHARTRRVLIRSLSARRLRHLKPRVQRLIDHGLDALVQHGAPADMHTQFSYPVTTAVICDCLGVPTEERHEFQALVDQTSSMYDQHLAQAGFGSLMAYIARLVEWKQHHPQEDVITDLIVSSRERDELTPEEVVRVSMGLLFAGTQSTASRIDIGTVLFLCHPDQLAAIQNKPSLIPQAVDEILRKATPNPAGALRRYAKQDIDFRGVHISSGDLLLVGPQTANHDPDAFPEPDEFNIARDSVHHIAFGYGRRFCLGAGLARLLLETAFSTLFVRLPTLRLAVPLQDLRLRDDLLTGGMAELPITW